MSHVVVSGGLGFIGSRLCRLLVDAGWRVTAIDDLSGRYAPGAGRAAASALAALPECDVAIARVEGKRAARLVSRADAVVHLAGAPGVRTRLNAERLAARNVEPTRRLAETAQRLGKRFLLVSTSSVYGDAALLPTPEHAVPAPLNGYANSKLAAERACLARGGVAVRLFTVYGPGQRPDMAFARWIDALAADRPLAWYAPPGAARDFTFVDDAAAGIVAALERGRPGEVYNVPGCGPVPVRAALARIEALIGRHARLELLDSGVREATVTAACGQKAERELGFVARTGIDAGLERQVAAALEAGERAVA